MLSAYLRTAGTIEIKNGKFGFSATQEPAITALMAKIITMLYGETPTIVKEPKSQRTKLILISDVSKQILIDAEILSFDRVKGVSVQLGLKGNLTKKQCCQRALLKGVFLGSGSITVPKLEKSTTTSYHMEFVFSKYVTALDFSHILSDSGYIAKLVERKDSFVVYFKNSEEICDLLVLMGAQIASLELTDIIVKKTVRNNANRVVNCEVSNINKQVEASLKQRNQIQAIINAVGLEKLHPNLRDVATARMEYPEDTLSQLAQRLDMTKSCLSHRLKKIAEIAESLQ
jgi:DNA-binding protein WhiA